MPTSLLKVSVDHALAGGQLALAERLLIAWAEQHALDCWVHLKGGDGRSYAFTGEGWERWEDGRGAVRVERADLPPGLVFCTFEG
jgi:hypothetical protein